MIEFETLAGVVDMAPQRRHRTVVIAIPSADLRLALKPDDLAAAIADDLRHICWATAVRRRFLVVPAAEASAVAAGLARAGVVHDPGDAAWDRLADVHADAAAGASPRLLRRWALAVAALHEVGRRPPSDGTPPGLAARLLLARQRAGLGMVQRCATQARPDQPLTAGLAVGLDHLGWLPDWDSPAVGA